MISSYVFSTSLKLCMFIYAFCLCSFPERHLVTSSQSLSKPLLVEQLSNPYTVKNEHNNMHTMCKSVYIAPFLECQTHFDIECVRHTSTSSVSDTYTVYSMQPKSEYRDSTMFYYRTKESWSIIQLVCHALW